MKYPFNVTQMRVDDMVFWVAKSTALKGCVGQGDTIEEALAELSENEIMWLETAEEMEITIPPVPVEQMTECSGKFTVRVAPYVHQKAAELAKKQNISLNQYVNDAIVAQNATLSSTYYIVPAVKTVIEEIKGLSPYRAIQSDKRLSLLQLFSNPYSDIKYTGSCVQSQSSGIRTSICTRRSQ